MNRGDVIYNFVVEYITQRGYAPTYREIMHGTGITSKASIHYWLGKLRAAGRLKWTPGVSRGIALPAPGQLNYSAEGLVNG